MDATKPTLFDVDSVTYPEFPGSKGTDTSLAAAEAIAPSVGRLQALVMTEVTDAAARGVTVVEMSDRTGLDRMSIQPRFSELRHLGKIADSGQRRRNPSGKSAIVWTLPAYALPAPERAA